MSSSRPTSDDVGLPNVPPCPDRTGPGAGAVRLRTAKPSCSSPSLDPHETNCGGFPFERRLDPNHAKSSRGDLSEPGLPVWAPFLANPLSTAIGLRHRCWWRDRQRVYRALDDVFPEGQRSPRFGICGLKAHVELSDADPPEYRLSAEFCRDRWCRPCQRERGRIIAANIVDHLDGARCRLVTLTIRTHQMPLADAIVKLYTSFARLRQTTFWRTRVTGGCAVCEVKRTQDDTRWHPHLHLLVQGNYIPQGWLAKHWYELTGDSYIVDVRSCTHAPDAARYVTKYLSKPVPSSIVRSPGSLREAMKALHGRRMVTTFGDWRGLRLTETESQAGWSKLCTYRELTDRVLLRDTEATRILSHLMGQADLNPSDLETWVRELLTYRKPLDPSLSFVSSPTPCTPDEHSVQT